ncbi:hypothetical protein ACT4VS_18195 (plasmid) [Acinetobacter baumannii]|uniref:hypothetical protein n=1 Tax=Pseudomonas aeruginosa TaxID=287 RepID=UPI001CBF77CC|nr:hypothetical protein [Pseudomonas aeruginosa]HBP1343812.1 hypothetical protein [Pseudomonas aeruginosa]HCJ6530751.1 hypothetical protein [Pseudomonas aeruginosa]HEJ2555992.1 hypothetical protein [Pseudomonas aeruginosa]
MLFEPDDFDGGSVGGAIAGVVLVVFLVLACFAFPALLGVVGPLLLIGGAVKGAGAMFGSNTPNSTKPQAGPNVFVAGAGKKANKGGLGGGPRRK